MKKRIISLLLVFACAITANAATIYLTDGGRIEGTVVSATAQNVQVHTPYGVQTIPSNRIARIDYRNDQVPSSPSRTSREPLGNDFVSLGLGFAAPVSRVDFSAAGGGSDDNGDVGFSLGLQYGHDIGRKVAAGFNVEYMGRGGTGSQSLVPEANTDVSGHSLLLLGTLKYSLVDRGAVRPYVLGGIGANRTSTVIDATPNEGFGWSDTNTGETRTLVDDSHWGLAYTARVGLDFMFSDPTFFSLEFGWNGLDNADAQATRSGRELGIENVTGDLNALTFAARWGWRF